MFYNWIDSSNKKSTVLIQIKIDSKIYFNIDKLQKKKILYCTIFQLEL